ncbi:MAG TPA: outer membrane beta-barrel protein [Blastocatellia bacterium]
MRKMYYIILAAAALLLTVPAQNAQAQSSETPKVEVGVNYTLLRTFGFDLGNISFNSTDSGIGGRLTFNLNDNFSLEGEYNNFPQDGRVNLGNLSSVNSHKSQALFGAKYGMRSEKFGIFGKFRPGFVRFSQGDPGALSIVPPSSETLFAFDIGGVFEIYPSRNVAFRFDLGNTLIRYSNADVFGDSFTQSNLQLSTGVAFRF